MALTSSVRETEEPAEADLVARAKHDPSAFGQLYVLYVQRVFGYLYNRIGNVPEAEDVTAQTFLAALEAFARYRHEGHFAAWLFSIARNKAMDHFRQRRNQIPLEEADHVPADMDVLQQVIQTERVATLVTLIASLPEAERDLIRLRYVAELSFRDIAQLLGRNEDAVKKSLYRLQDRLSSQLEHSRDH
ncbi:MAG: sigma-70 family RNA polymerase sigma factor [Chloroflexi bacterium]|nr:sigma-70 family RNA polymerase sigma factor [Chloroflexota bacterium]